MRTILYKHLTSLKDRRRIISVSDRSENKKVSTHIHRTFVYVVSKEEMESVTELPAPVFQITKHYNTHTLEEKFFFRVKGIFYILREDRYLLVHFCHSLRVDVVPKEAASVSF